MAGCEEPHGIGAFEEAAAGRDAPRRSESVCRIDDHGTYGTATWRIVTDPAGRPLWGTHVASGGATRVVRWRRDSDGDAAVTRRVVGRMLTGGFVAEAVTETGHRDGRPAWRTENGRDIGRWAWDEQGRLVEETTTSADLDVTRRTWTYRGDELRSFTIELPGVGTLSSSYAWDGARIAQETVSSDSGYSRLEWAAWDGDLPTHGDAVRKYYDWTSEGPAWTDEWTWEAGRPTSWTRTEAEGDVWRSEWTWDGDLLLTSPAETWTWNEDGLPISVERADEIVTWTWAGSRLVERTVTRLDADIWTSRTWGRGCPPAAWADFLEEPGLPSPIPTARPTIQPLPTEWW